MIRRTPSRLGPGIIPRVILLLVLGAGAVTFVMISDAPQQALKQPPRPTAVAVKPAPPPGGFVGSKVCAECHAEIAETYDKHPMARSLGRVADVVDVENFDIEQSSFVSAGRHYTVEKTDGEDWHRESSKDSTGELICENATQVHYVLGSGARGRSYLIDRGGLLFQSPISWYSQQGKWDLSPGYQQPTDFKFERRVGDGCLSCHAGRVAAAGRNLEDRYEQPVFLEAAIGCERCHGPGGDHVDVMRDSSPPDDMAIVNPAKLQPRLRDSVCYQCHLASGARILRYGRTHRDFRPGMALEDVWTFQIHDASVRADGTTKAVSQVEQMRMSGCYKAAKGQFSCITCHDPHRVPDPNQITDHYRRRCNTCHQEAGCALPHDQRLAPPAANSCIYCHMPDLESHDIAHTAQTDHRILRHARRSPTDPEIETPADGGQSSAFFDDADARLPEWERARAHGLSLVDHLRTTQDKSRLEECEQLLRSVLESAPDDILVIRTLVEIATIKGDAQRAGEYLSQGLASYPNDESLLSMQAAQFYGSGDYSSGLKYYQRLFAINPWNAWNFSRDAHMREVFGDLSGAIAAAERGLELEPHSTELREMAVKIYAKMGNEEQVSHHRRILQQLRSLNR